MSSLYVSKTRLLSIANDLHTMSALTAEIKYKIQNNNGKTEELYTILDELSALSASLHYDITDITDTRQ